MSVDVAAETVIHRPVDMVAAYAIDPSNAPEWYANIDSIEWLTEPKVETGAKVAFVARLPPPTARIQLRVHRGGHRMRGSSCAPRRDCFPWRPPTRGPQPATVRRGMTLCNRGEPAGFSKLVAPFLARAVKRANQKDLAKLKSILESR